VRASIHPHPQRFLATLLAVGVMVGAASCNQAEVIRQDAIANSRAVTFASTDGVKLSGRMFGPDDATAGVILAHMLPADQSSWFDFAQRLGTSGYRALTFDFRGYCPGGDAGCSKGEKATGAIWQDVLGAVAYLKTQGINRFALVGASMGGTASLVASSQQPEGIAAVVTLSAPESIDGLTAGPDVMQTIAAAKLFIAGTLDTVAAQSATAFFNESIQPKREELLTTADHGTDMLTGNQGEQTGNLIEDWLSLHLPATVPAGNP
jgi:pimeloyl-ACP methyl ester carboxylesterase